MLLSIAVVAIPAGIFSAGFVTEFRAQDAHERRHERREKREAALDEERDDAQDDETQQDEDGSGPQSS